jgi:hypothetical protein
MRLSLTDAQECHQHVKPSQEASSTRTDFDWTSIYLFGFFLWKATHYVCSWRFSEFLRVSFQVMVGANED